VCAGTWALRIQPQQDQSQDTAGHLMIRRGPVLAASRNVRVRAFVAHRNVDGPMKTLRASRCPSSQPSASGLGLTGSPLSGRQARRTPSRAFEFVVGAVRAAGSITGRSQRRPGQRAFRCSKSNTCVERPRCPNFRHLTNIAPRPGRRARLAAAHRGSGDDPGLHSPGGGGTGPACEATLRRPFRPLCGPPPGRGRWCDG
jgi:hypothetical protein